jgi:hypothetical protein
VKTYLKNDPEKPLSNLPELRGVFSARGEALKLERLWTLHKKILVSLLMRSKNV